MNWTAIVPLKPPAARKSRLAATIEPAPRAALAQALFDRVTTALCATPRITTIALLVAEIPEGWEGSAFIDRGRGLNAELDMARATLGDGAVIVLHADLPFVGADDIAALLDAAEASGCAVAPDRHGHGTNALAIADGRPFRYRFGEDSKRAHVEECGAGCVVVERDGLGFDCDTPEDLALALARGFAPSSV